MSATSGQGRPCRPRRLGRAWVGTMTLAACVLAAEAGLTPPPAAAIVPVLSRSALPCTLRVYDDEIYQGCDDVRAGSASGSFLAGVGDHAILTMRAWRKRRADSVFDSPVRTDSGAVRGVGVEITFERRMEPYHRRDQARRTLQSFMDETVAIDSMAAVIHADSASLVTGVVDVDFWIARTVRIGRGTIRRIDRLDLREAWLPVARQPWVFLGYEEIATESWALGDVRDEEPGFPARPGRAEHPSVIGEMGDPVVEMDRASSDVSPIDGTMLPPTLEPGMMVGPFSNGCLRDPSQSAATSHVEEPVPALSVQPAYPEIAREARISGEVILHVFVCEDGRVGWIRVASGHPVLSAAAVAAVSQWTFVPARAADGRAVPAWLEIPVDFHF